MRQYVVAAHLLHHQAFTEMRVKYWFMVPTAVESSRTVYDISTIFFFLVKQKYDISTSTYADYGLKCFV